jgi:hypothetical protein
MSSAKLNPETPTRFDVIAELSAETLQQSVQQYDAKQGKFIRFGRMIIIGPATPTQPSGLSVAHIDIAHASFNHPDKSFRARVQSAADEADPAESIGADYPGMLDAGHYELKLGEDHIVRGIEFDGISSTFRRSAELRGRPETGYIAQKALGSAILVLAI